MPSGAKKRKAAKKKKEAHNNKNSSNNGNSNNPQVLGNDDARSQDERDSDSGEVSSPLSQDRQPPFSEENDEYEKRDASSTWSFVSKYKPQETGNEEVSKEAALQDNAAINIESKFAKEDSESQVVHIEYVESAKDAHDRDHRSSRSSSSDESRSYQKKWNEEKNDMKLKTSSNNLEEKAVGTYSKDVPQSFDKEKPLVEHNGNTVVEVAPIDMSTPVVPVSVVAERVMESSEVQSTEVLEMDESGLPQNKDKPFPNSSEVASVSFDAVASANDDKVFPTFEEIDGTTLKATGLVISGSESKTLTSSDHTAETSINADTVNDSMTSNDLPDGSKDEELPMSNVLTARSSDVALKSKDSETHESTEHKPLIAPAPLVAQRTSWMNCCGLLDVFTGSGR